jgi:hypothetical protein
VQTIPKGEVPGRNTEYFDDAVRRKECTADRNEENIGGKAGRVANDSYGSMCCVLTRQNCVKRSGG